RHEGGLEVFGHGDADGGDVDRPEPGRRKVHDRLHRIGLAVDDADIARQFVGYPEFRRGHDEAARPGAYDDVVGGDFVLDVDHVDDVVIATGDVKQRVLVVEMHIAGAARRADRLDGRIVPRAKDDDLFGGLVADEDLTGSGRLRRRTDHGGDRKDPGAQQR